MAIKKSDPEVMQQLALEFDLPEPDENAGLSQEDVERISLAAMQAFESAKADADKTIGGWFTDYLKLKELGYDWRLSAYIAWESSPKADRWPATIQELATEVLGLKSPRVIYTWRKKNPDIDTVISMMQSAPLYAHRRDVIDALVAVAKNPDYKGHQDRKLFFEMIGDHTPRQQVEVNDRRVTKDDLSSLTDEELRRRADMLRESEPPAAPEGMEDRDE